MIVNDDTDESLFDARCALAAAESSAPASPIVASVFASVRAQLDLLDAVLRAGEPEPEDAPEWAERDARAEHGT